MSDIQLDTRNEAGNSSMDEHLMVQQDYEYEEEYTRAIAIKRTSVNDDVVDNTPPPPVYRLAIALFSIVSYIGAYALDMLLLKQYYTRSQWIFFWITLTFIVIPSIIIQLLSCKWFHDDNGCLKPWSIVLHIFMLGPVERFVYILIHGRKARASDKDRKSKRIYLENWRDVSMLRFLYAFLETGPQVTLQLYIMLTFQLDPHEGSLTQEHIITIFKVLASVAELASSMVTYNDDLRIADGDAIPIPGFITQIIYRLLIIASRILTLVLFTMQFKLYVLIVFLGHWFVMIVWIRLDKTNFFIKNGKCDGFFEVLFQVLMAFIYMFCYITTAPGPTVVKQMVYYLFFFLENISMMLIWIWFNGRQLDSFEISAITVVFTTMVLGVLFLIAYYKIFHPKIAGVRGRSVREHRERLTVLATKNAFFSRDVFF